MSVVVERQSAAHEFGVARSNWGVVKEEIPVVGAGDVARLLESLRAQLTGMEMEERPQKAYTPAEDFTWLDDVYSALHASRQDDAVDLLFDNIDDMLLAGELARANDLLLVVDVKRLDITTMLAVLSVTRPASEELSNRTGFLGRVERRLRQDAPERVESLLSGLR